jgi:hypothetical protein
MVILDLKGIRVFRQIHMKSKLIVIFFCFITISLHAQHAKKLFLTPTIGIKSDISSSTRDVQFPEDYYFQFYSPRFNFLGLSPLVLGLGLEYKWKEHFFGAGIYYGDQANSTIGVKFKVDTDDPYSNYYKVINQSNYAGWPLFKVPLSYKYTLMQKANSKNNGLSINLNTGINLLFLRIKNEPMLRNPISWGPNITKFGDTVEFVGFEGHLNRSFSLSFNLGVDFELQFNSKRRIALQLFYEQGTRLITQAAYVVYKNSDENYWFGISSMSRGSSLHLKLCFPIGLL